MAVGDLTARQRRLIIFGVLGVIALGALVWAFRPRPVPVDLATVSRGAMSVELSEEAKTRIREVYVLSAPVTGRLERVEVKPGDPAMAGSTAVVATMLPVDPVLLDRRSLAELQNAATSAEAARDAAAADVRRANSEYEQSQSDFDRDVRLFESGTIAKARYDATVSTRDGARAAWDSAREGLRAREADLARARAALIGPGSGEEGSNSLDLHAPVDGVVLSVFQESESVVQAGAQILSIGDPRDLEIVSEMLSVDAVRIKPGAPVRIDGWGGPPLEGHVRRVEPSAFTKVSALGVEEQRVNVLIDIDSPREDWLGLAHLFRVDVHVEVWSAPDALRIPTAAIFREAGGWATFADMNGRARTVAVGIGEMNADTAEVTSGLDEDATVILHPSDRVQDGVRVAGRS